MSNENHETKSKLEIFKTFSTFFSSVIIALAGIVITTQYNNRQLEITQKQVESQLSLARIKEISTLVPKLGSSNEGERRFSAITLGLYGEDAIPALIAVIEDPKETVRRASAEALAIIGEASIPVLEETYLDKSNNPIKRGMSLYTLGLMKAKGASNHAKSALENTMENPYVRVNAANVIGFLRDKESVEILLSTLRKVKNIDKKPDRQCSLVIKTNWRFNKRARYFSIIITRR